MSEKQDQEELSLFDLPDAPPDWSEEGRRAVDRAVAGEVSSDAIAVFARWSQVELWLRTLVYLELRAKRGRGWTEPLPSIDPAAKDAANRYMPTPDAANPLAYLDTFQLLDVVGSEDVWPFVEYALMPRSRWNGVMVEQLRSVRNRIAHIRRPHADDLKRVEQALRDLEPGARLAMESFNRERWYPNDPEDSLAIAWVDAKHADATRLIKHAERQYDVAFQLAYSARPWAKLSEGAPLSAQSGVLIHASWHLRDGALIRPRSFWEDDQLDAVGVRDLIVVVGHPDPSQISICFSAADAADLVADAIGEAFELVIRHRQRNPDRRTYKRWRLEAQNLDWRVQVESTLLLAAEGQPFSVFGA